MEIRYQIHYRDAQTGQTGLLNNEQYKSDVYAQNIARQANEAHGGQRTHWVRYIVVHDNDNTN